MKRAATGLGLVAGLMLGLGGTAWAGEYTGNGYGDTQGPAHAKSECVYSGLDQPDAEEGNPPQFNDDALTQRGEADNGKFRGAQNYGQFPSSGVEAPASPGMACNPTAGEGAG